MPYLPIKSLINYFLFLNSLQFFFLIQYISLPLHLRFQAVSVHFLNKDNSGNLKTNHSQKRN